MDRRLSARVVVDANPSGDINAGRRVLGEGRACEGGDAACRPTAYDVGACAPLGRVRRAEVPVRQASSIFVT